MRRFVFVLAALLSAAPWAHAQPSGILAGTVRTSEGTPVPNLVLIVRGPDATRTVVTGFSNRPRRTLTWTSQVPASGSSTVPA